MGHARRSSTPGRNLAYTTDTLRPLLRQLVYRLTHPTGISPTLRKRMDPKKAISITQLEKVDYGMKESLLPSSSRPRTRQPESKEEKSSCSDQARLKPSRKLDLSLIISTASLESDYQAAGGYRPSFYRKLMSITQLTRQGMTIRNKEMQAIGGILR